MTGHGHHSMIEDVPLTGVAAGLLLAVLPLLSHLAPWALALFGGALLMRLLVNRLHLGLPPVAVKVTVLALGLTGIALAYGSFFGIEPGLGILLILVSLKLLETNTVRDFQVLTLLGWFLSLCALFFSQTLGTWLYISTVGALLTASLIRFHSGPRAGDFRRSAGLTVKLLFQAIPIIVLLFVFFPRTAGGFRLNFSRVMTNVSGMSDRLEPGSVAAVAMSEEIAFRVTFPDGNAPPLPQLYWRGAVLWSGEGLSWQAGTVESIEGRIGQAVGPPVRQQIALEPHGGKWLFALDRPVGNVSDAVYKAGGYLQSVKPISSVRQYEVTSRPENHETILLHEHRRAALQLPAHVTPRVQALVESWRATTKSDREMIDSALRYFRNNRFLYTLEPGAYGSNALDEFLFERRTGFCEHYAAAFATLMRIAGIPARLVIGYHGGLINRSYIIVRQSESHVWCEVWLRDSGWQRVDPTSVIAPERLSSGLEAYLESRASAEHAGGGESSSMMAGLRDILRDVRLAWDNLSYQWDLRVLNFDEDNQQLFFALIGLSQVDWPALVTWNVTSAAGLLALLALWFSRPARIRRNATVRHYDRFCGILAAAGLAREPFEGPLTFCGRASDSFPEHASKIQRIRDLYIDLRYANKTSGAADLARAVRTLRGIRRRPGKNENGKRSSSTGA